MNGMNLNWIYLRLSAIPDKYFICFLNVKNYKPIINEEFDEKFINLIIFTLRELVVVRIIF